MVPIDLDPVRLLQWQHCDASARIAEADLAHAWAEFAAGKFLPPSRRLVESAIHFRRESDLKLAQLRAAA